MSFSFHLAQTPRAGVTPSREDGIERRAQGNVLSSAAVFAGRCDLGQWRQAAWNEKRRLKTPVTPGFAEYGSPCYIRRRYRGLVPPFPRETGEERSLFSQ